MDFTQVLWILLKAYLTPKFNIVGGILKINAWFELENEMF